MGIYLFSFFSAIPVSMYRVWVVLQMWVWFVIPAFGISAPQFWVAFGLMELIALLRMKTPKKDGEKPDLDQVVFSVMHSLTASSFALLVGWVISQLI